MTRTGRLAFVRTAVVLILGCAVLAACSPPPPAKGEAGSTKQPNIVFVLTDDLSMNLLPYMPHVAALEQQGTTFSHYFVVDSLCCPSRSAIFTGQYPHDDGVYTNHSIDGGYAAFNRHHGADKTFAVSLQHAGYQTAMMGKYLNGYQPSDPPAQGWNEWDVAGDAYAEYSYQLNQDGIPVQYGHDPDDYLTDVLSQRAGHFIDGAAAHPAPFALEVATFAPHRPATPAPRNARSFSTARVPHGPSWGTPPTDGPSWIRDFPPLTRKNVASMNRVYRKRIESVQAVDDLIGHLENRLRAHNMLKRTYFVFSSDNGFHIGEHNLFSGKQTAFDTDIHVPLVVTGPGVPAGHTVNAMTSSIDLAPTFDQIGHAAPSGSPDGTSLLALMHGAAPPKDWQRAVLVEHHGPDFDNSDPDIQPVRAGNPPTYEAIRTPDATYVEYQNGEREYYDLRDDPYELHNLASSAPAGVLAPLHTTLQALRNCHGTQQCQAAARAAG